MSRPRKTMILAALVALLHAGAVPDPATAEEDAPEAPTATREMSETAAPFVKPESRISLGLGIRDGVREQFGVFDNARGSGLEALLEADLTLRDDTTGRWTTARVRNLGRDNRNVCLGLETQGAWGAELGFRQMPRIAPYTPYSNNSGLGTTSQVVAKPATPGLGGPVTIGTRRDRTTFEAYKVFAKDFRVNLSVRNEEKSGNRQWGRGSAPEFLLEPIDWTIREFGTHVDYLGKGLQLALGYNGSWFENSNALVDAIANTDNPAVLGNHTYLTLPLDNQAHKFEVSGGIDLTPENHGTFKVSYNRATQNEHLPTSEITGLALASAPASLQGEVNSFLAQGNLSSRPLANLKLETQLRYFADEDRTPTWLITTANPNINVHTTPISLRSTTGKLEGTYRLADRTHLTAGVERRLQDREIPYGNDNVSDGMDDERFVPFRSDLDETTYKLQLRHTFSELASGSLTLQQADREGSELTKSVKIMGSGPGKIAPFHISDRERRRARLAFDLRPMDPLGVQLSSEFTEDRFQPGVDPYGRRKGRTQLYSVDADYAPTNHWLVTAWYSRQIDEEWLSTGRFDTNTTHEADKNSDLRDGADSLGLGISNQFSRALKFGAEFHWDRVKSRYQEEIITDPTNAGADPAYPTAAGVTLTPLPSIVSNPQKWHAFAEYSGLGPGSLRFDVEHERWESDDWSWEFSDGSPFVYGTTTDGTVMLANGSQSSTFVGISYSTRY
ncbi:MAG: MtrB/PioB family decaheme-associated outer membrane protein [Magnetococcales bacterium]|nr:MtrB/PioB family decaheme-associated outer membrane protein [Magnetococcales bacterium]